MTSRLLVFILLFAALPALKAQTSAAADPQRKEIETVLNAFMRSIRDKDSTTFLSLFYDGPIGWAGAYKEKSQQKRLLKNPAAKSWFTDDHRSFIRGIVSDKEPNEEKFDNIQIIHDESIATVSFDYSYWFNGQKSNWGKESWGLVNANGKWKITSVLFSMEMN